MFRAWGRWIRPAKFADLAVGETVVIHATPKGEELEADEVKFSGGAAGGEAVSGVALGV